MKRFLYLICVLALASTAIARLGTARRIAAPAAVVAGGGGTLLLDETGLGSAAAAYAVNKLRAAYSGYFVRIRRSSDNAEADFGDDGTGWITSSSVAANGSNPILDGQSLATFFLAVNGFVVTAYNQSGSATGNATQRSASYQPQIVSSGSLVTQNGVPAMLADSTSALTATNLTLTAQTVMLVWRGTTAGMLVETGAGGSANDFYIYGTTDASTSIARSSIRSSKNLSASWANSADHRLIEQYHNGTHASIHLFIDNADQSLTTYSSQSGNIGTTSTTGTLNILSRNNGASLQSQGYLSLLVIWSSDLNDAGTRSTAAANINAAYALY